MSTLKNNGRNDSFLVQAVSRNENGWCCKFCNDAFSTWLASGSLQNLRNIQFNENPTSNFWPDHIKSNRIKSNKIKLSKLRRRRKWAKHNKDA